MSKRPKVLVTNPLVYQVSLDLLKEKCDLIMCEGSPVTKDEILEKVKGVDAIYWSSVVQVNESILNAAGPNLKVIGTCSVGYDHIDVKLLKARGVKLGNTADVLSDCVAEVAVALTLTAAHRIQEGYLKIIRDEWSSGRDSPQWLTGYQLSDSVVGIVGLGRIGVEIAIRLQSFKIKELLYTGNNEKPIGKEIGAKFVSMDELLAQSDFIVIACSLNENTRNLFDKTLFDKMKSNAILVNIGRGDIINQDDLIDALKNKKIGGAGLDVMTPEPLPPDHPLTKLNNCVLSPHIGSATRQTRTKMAVLTAHNILAALENQPMPSEVL